MPYAISPAQIRGARAMLNWSMMDLAKAAGVSVSTVKRAEETAPERASVSACGALCDAFTAAGVTLLPDQGEGEGVRLKDG